MTARLVLRGEGGAIRSVRIDDAVRIGRGPNAALTVDGGVTPGDSARVTCDADNWWIEDMDGRLGVHLNGERVTRGRLRHLDVLSIGTDAHAIFLRDENAAEAVGPPAEPAVAAVPSVTEPAVGADVQVAERPAPDAVADMSPETIYERPVAVPPPRAADEAGATVYERPFAMPVMFRDTAPPVAPGGEAGATVYERPAALPAPPVGLTPDARGGESAGQAVYEPLSPARAPLPLPDPSLSLFEAAPALPPAAPPDAEAEVRAGVGLRLAGAEGTFDLPLGRSIVGRGRNVTVRIDNKEVSRVHAAIVVTPTGATVEDLGSANGTTVNGAPAIGARSLVEGDRLSLGRLEFRCGFTRLDGDA